MSGEQKGENEDGTIDANGGDTTSSTPLSEDEMKDDNAETPPLTGNVLNPSTGEAVKTE